MKKNKKATLAIIQLARFGDLIQTLQAAEEVKKAHPSYRLVLIARSQFATPLEFLLSNVFNKIYYLDTLNIISHSESDNLQKSLNNLNIFLGEIATESIDVLINLSFSKSSSYLSSLIKSNYKIGPYYDYNNQLKINDKWSQFLYSHVLRGSLNPYSLVDLFKNIIGVKSSETKQHHSLQNLKSTSIIIHPFASDERKMWKSEKWVEVIYKTLKENDSYSISIIGSKEEVARSHSISDSPLLKAFPERIQNLTGKTSIPELALEIKKARLFVGHDSMAGHLASLYNIPTLTISLGSVRPQETTPYHSNAYNITPRTKCFPCFTTTACSYNQCHHDIPYQIVSTSIKELLENGHITPERLKSSISNFHISSVNFYASRFNKNHFELSPLIDSHLDSSDIFRSLFKIVWSFVLNDQEEVVPFPKLTPTTHEDLLNTLTGIQHLYELSEFGKKYSLYILEEISSHTPSVTKIKEFSKKIDEIDQLQKLVLKTAPYLTPIVEYFFLRKANLSGENIVELTESSFHVFAENSSFCSILFELIENTISEHKNSLNRNIHKNEITR